MFDSIQCLLTITAAINGHCSRPPAVTLKDYSGTVQEEEIFFFFFFKKKKKKIYMILSGGLKIFTLVPRCFCYL